MTPALTSSSLNLPMSTNIWLSSGEGFMPSSLSSVAFTNTITRIVGLLVSPKANRSLLSLRRTAGCRIDTACVFFRILSTSAQQMLSHKLRDVATSRHGEKRGHDMHPALLDEASDADSGRSEEHTSELQSPSNLLCRL